MPDSAAFEVRVRIPVRWRDLDMLGHMNQAVYHELLEEGRTALFAELGHFGDFAFVLARVELDYRNEVRRDHEAVDVVVRIASVGRSSLVVDNQIVLPDGTVSAEGRSVLVAWDPTARASRPLSEEQRTQLEGLAAAGAA
jgi:acyl-CoA thioester hydrolase